MTENFPALVDTQLELVARHWTDAGEAEPAIAAWRKAGDAAFERSAFKEAEEAYRQTLAILRALSESRERDERELELMNRFARVLQLTRGWASPEAAEAAAHAQALAERSDNLAQLILQTVGSFAAVVTRGDLPAAGALADRILDLARRDGSPASWGLGNSCEVMTCYFRGDLSGAEKHFIAGVSTFEASATKFPATLAAGFRRPRLLLARSKGERDRSARPRLRRLALEAADRLRSFMFFGLQRLSALTGSLLLNLEGPFTTLIAVGVLSEHLGKREMFAAAAIMLGGVLIGFQPGHVGGSWIGALEITVACLSWGIDNNLTQRVSLRDPVAVARIKTLAAGSCVLVIALWQGSGEIPGATSLVYAGGVGALCYGVSIVLDVKELRALGAAREAAYFATAPFVGALLSIVVFREFPNLSDLSGATLMISGVFVLLLEKHSHRHKHEAISHEHLHLHDEHHQHAHDDLAAEPHSHPHEHSSLIHDHPHVSDLHHRHSHKLANAERE